MAAELRRQRSVDSMSLPAVPGRAEARGEFFGPVFLRIGVMELIAYLLASVGLTVLIIWPEGGPGAFFREKVLRRVLPAHGPGDHLSLTPFAPIFLLIFGLGNARWLQTGDLW